VRQKLKIFVSLAYAAIFLVFLGVGALPTMAVAPIPAAPIPAAMVGGNEVQSAQGSKFFPPRGTPVATGSLN
jgi:hypothetical protein